MKSSAAVAAILAFSAPALAVNSGWRAIEAVNVETGKSLGYLWSEANGLQYSDPVYGDERFDFMFRKGSNNKLVEVSDEPAGTEMRCARESPSPCSGTAYFEVGGGEWEAGNYLVRGGFRYEGTPNYKRDEFFVNNYNNATGRAELKYAGSNDRDEPHAFYGMCPRSTMKIRTKGVLTNDIACGDIPITENDEPNGDLYIKYANEPTPDECQDIILQAQFAVGTGTMDWTKSEGCMVFNHGIC
jgi:hypothetical protein